MMMPIPIPVTRFALQADVLAVLAADLEDRVHLGVEVCGSRGLSRNLVVDMLGAQKRPHDLSRRSRRPDEADSTIPDLLRQRLEAFFGCLHRIAVRPPVV